MKNLESMTWGEIERKDQSHLIPVAGICSEARKRLDEIKLDDRDILYSLRLTGSERLWGIRDYDSFYLLWWDPNHSVYPVSKKHT
ncbi:MAG: hypothetical protein GY765_09470 [bacterium]|nr:hypothetical protein [bacterium]